MHVRDTMRAMNLASTSQYSIATALTLGVFLLGSAGLQLPILGTIGLLSVLAVASMRLGNLFSHELASLRLLLGGIVSLSFLMIAGSTIYYLSVVTTFTFLWPVVALPFFAWLVTRKIEPPATSATQDASAFSSLFAALVVIALVAFFVTLTGNVTVEPSRSPWLVIAPAILWWTGLAGFSLFQLAKRGQIRLSVFGSIATLFSGLSIALFVFPLGYGFDPFLHQATLDHITLHGTITPKPYYYIGQYAIEMIGILFTGISSHALDIALLPVLASILLPTVAAASLWHITRRHVPTALAAVGTLLLPLSSFINTTPQGLANLWSLCVFFLALPELVTGHRWLPRWVLVLVAIAAILIHPLAGLPAALFVALTLIATQESWPSWGRWTLGTFASLGGAVMLPVAFSVSGPSSSFGFNISNLSALIPNTFLSTRFDVLGDLATYLGTNQWLWLIGLAIVAGVILTSMTRRTWLILPLTAGLLLINAIILSVAGDFSFLIDYEQTNYVDRVVTLTIFAIAPLAIVGFSLGMERLLQMKKGLVTTGLMVIFLATVGANVYASYPRHDAYNESRGFTVGESDHKTVASIESHAGGDPYIVLANQAVAAAAIQDFGFAHYYGPNEDVFYYPVPTGGPMYQIFLEMIEETATRDLATQAMDLAGVNRAYFVVNDYWWSADRAVERAKLSTEDWFLIDDGATTVFVYTR